MLPEQVMFIRQNGGTLSKQRRQGEFERLTDDEVERIERTVGDAFAGLAHAPGVLREPAADA